MNDSSTTGLQNPRTERLPAETHPDVVRGLPTTQWAGRGLPLLEEILNSHEFNWYGTSWMEKPPPPALRKEGEAYRQAVRIHGELSGSMEPATDDELGNVFYRLQGHYWTPNMTDSLARSVAWDYARLLGEKYPVDVLQAACDAWLMNPEKKFFPKPGELDEVLKTKLFTKQFRIRKLQRLLDLAE